MARRAGRGPCGSARRSFCVEFGMNDPLWRCAPRPYAKAPGVRHSKSQIVGFSSAARTVPHPPRGGRIGRRTLSPSSLILRCERSEPRRTHLFITTPAFASGHCQRTPSTRVGSGALGRAFLMLVRGATSAPRSVSVPKLAGHNARSMYIPWTRRRGFSASCAICPWSFRCKLVACSFQPGHAAAGRRPVSGPRVPGYHTRAGGHRRSPRSRFQNPVPQER